MTTPGAQTDVSGRSTGRVIVIVALVAVLAVGGYLAVRFTRHSTVGLTHAACVPGSWLGLDYYDAGVQKDADPGTMTFKSDGTGSYHASYVVLQVGGTGSYAAYNRNWTFHYTADGSAIHLTDLAGTTFITNQQTGLGTSVRPKSSTLAVDYTCGSDQLKVTLPEYAADFIRH